MRIIIHQEKTFRLTLDNKRSIVQNGTLPHAQGHSLDHFDLINIALIFPEVYEPFGASFDAASSF